LRPSVADRPLYPVNRLHLDELGGRYGIWQHAQASSPNESYGYCTDDVSRALLVDLLHARQLGWAAVAPTAWRSIRFLDDAFSPSTGRFRNLRDRDGSWIEATGSEDCHGRALLALGTLLAEAPEDAAVDRARPLFRAALPAANQMRSPRAIASTLLGCAAAMTVGLRGETQPTLERLSFTLGRAFARVRLDNDWPWPEASLTYENGLLPQAVLTAGAVLGDYDLRRTGLRALDWLIGVQTAAGGTFAPIGCNGWWPHGGVRSRFDQQPIEATATILAAGAAFHHTGDERYWRAAEAAYGWFLGDNDMGVALADPTRGSCHDGLTAKGANLNEGAESTLMWLTALEHLRDIRSAAACVPGVRLLAPTQTDARR
jgi:hypothetical protein